MRKITPRAKFTIEADLTPVHNGAGVLKTPKMFIQTDLNVSDIDVAIMFLNMAKHHMVQSGSQEELSRQFIAFMNYHSDIINPNTREPIELLHLPSRLENVLIKHNIDTVPKLRRELKHITAYKGIGKKALQYISEALINY